MRKGQKMSEESRRLLSETNKARGIRPPSQLGVPNTEEQKAKISATHKAMGHKPSPMYGDDNPSRRPEVRAKISATRTGKPLSDEHKAALSRSHRRFTSGEAKAKMRVTHRARIAAGLWPWQGGKTPETLRIRHSSEYADWRTAVFQRDDYTCQSCNQRGGRLQAHHIKTFAHYPDLRFDVPNGITLCKECHIKIHREDVSYE